MIAFITYTLTREALCALMNISRYPESWQWWIAALLPVVGGVALWVAVSVLRPYPRAILRAGLVGYSTLSAAVAVFTYFYYSPL